MRGAGAPEQDCRDVDTDEADRTAPAHDHEGRIARALASADRLCGLRFTP